MNLDHMTELAFTRLTWREKLAVLHIELWHALRRLFRREHRYYILLAGRPVAKFTADVDHTTLLTWLTDSHVQAHASGVQLGKEAVVEQIKAGLKNLPSLAANAESAGPS